jgi:uncharacterized Rmd1/YagE family protein
MSREHSFQALAFPENVPLRSLAEHFPQARRSTLELTVELEGGGTMFLYPFGAVVFQDVDPARRDAQLELLRRVEHLLDKPDAAWDDPAMDAIYEDLRDEFDLGDR